jgi:hypothetical protein
MKNLRVFLGLILAVFMVGCTTTGDPSATLQEVELTFQDAAEIIVPELLIEKPADRPKYEKALVQLDALANSTNSTPADLTLLLNPLIDRQLKGRDARLAKAGAMLVIRRAGRNIAIEQPDVVRVAARGAAAGLRNALKGTP